MSPTFMVVGSLCLGLAAIVIVATVLGRLATGKWTAIVLATLAGPFVMLAAIKASATVYWSLTTDQGSGCSGGECGSDAIAAGYWPLLILFFLPVAFVLAWPTIAIQRRRRK